MLEITNTENAWTFFEEILNHEMEKNIPRSRTKRENHILTEKLRGK